MAAVAELIRPIEEAMSFSRKGSRLSLSQEQLADGQALLTKAIESIRRERDRIEEAKQGVRDAPEQILAVMLAEKMASAAAEAEAMLASSLADMLARLDADWEPETRRHVQKVYEVSREMAELQRDARWQFMAMAAERRPAGEILEPMTIGELRKRAAR